MFCKLGGFFAGYIFSMKSTVPQNFCGLHLTYELHVFEKRKSLGLCSQAFLIS